MKQDRFFDGLSKRFRDRIYGGDPRGQIRLSIVQDDILSQLSATTYPTAMQVLDAGGGLGQMSLWLAELGHQVVLAEPSLDMLEEARECIAASGQAERILLQKASIQDLVTQQPLPQFDGIVLHAVLEWLAEPYETLQQLISLLKPRGWLSLMFFNQYSTEMRHLLSGNFRPILEDTIASDGQRGLAPISPCIPGEVLSWLPNLKLELLTWSGVRCFYDYAYPKVRQAMPIEDLLLLERRYSQREPWRSLARYQHVFCKKMP